MKTGTVINNRYRVLCRAGHGGTSNVYKVYDTNVGRELAMKIIRCDRPAYYMLARGEIDTLKSIKYPLFPTIHDAFTKGREMYILSDFIDGIRLDEFIADGRMSRDDSLRIIGRIADALSYLHELKNPILYLDLKPENIIVDAKGLPMLVDFGIARQITQKRICMGTYGYSPPEQYIKGGDVDERSDIYSLGMTYMAMRCRHSPEREYEKNRETIKKSKCFNKLEKTFLLKATSYEKSDRYSCMRDAKREIEHIRIYPKKTIKRFATVLAVISIVLTGGYFIKNSLYARREEEAALRMVKDASKYMHDGEYTKEGMSIIRSFVQSGCLNRETEQKFIREVARNCLFIQKDYRTASVYYSKLDEDTYPGASDYAGLCRMIAGFEKRGEDSVRLIGIYYEDVLEMNPSIAKYEDMIIAAELFEEYEEDRMEGIKKSITVLREGEKTINEEFRLLAKEDKESAGLVKKKMIDLQQKKNMRAEEISKVKLGGK